VLHIDSVLVRTMKNPRWKAHARVFPSIHTWPDQMDLWDRWEEIFVNDSEDAADAFYRLNQREMDFGAVVSWPGKRPLVELMKLRAEDHHAFETEHQHNPIEPDGHPFAGVIQYWVSLPRDWAFYGAHDPSMGKAARTRDPSASLVGAKDRKSGKLCIADAIVARRVPDKQVSDLIKLQREYQCLVWAFESIAFQEFFRQHVVKESAAKGVPIPARAVISKVDKDLRIESMQPHVSNGLILFNRNHKTLLAQLEYWPDSDHDDGPDALEMLWQISLSGASSGASGLRAGKRQSSDVLKGYIDG